MDLNLDAPHSMGTTIIGVTYNGGVVLGADSRTSTGEIPSSVYSVNWACVEVSFRSIVLFGESILRKAD